MILLQSESIPDSHPDFMAYTRGSSSDWGRYAKLTGDPGWSWKGIQPFLRKVRAVYVGRSES